MEFVLVAAVTLLLCWLADKGFTKLFRSKPQHFSGKAVRLSKYYAVGGLVLLLLGVAALFAGTDQQWFLYAGGGMLILIGIGMIVYYLTFGIYYDEDGFLVTSFGKMSKTYAYRDIRSQQLYVTQGGGTLIELYMDCGTVQMQSTMTGVYEFLDHAFARWCVQTGRSPEDCDFYDPANSLWFPREEG